MADFITSVSTISGLRTWWDSTVPSTVNTTDQYIAELAAGSYDLSSVSTTWGGKTVLGRIIIRPQTSARLTTTTRPLRIGTDGVVFSFPNSNVNFTSASVTIDGCQFSSNAAPSATLQLSAGGMVSRCILDDVKVTFDNNAGALFYNLIERTQSDVCAWLPSTCTVVNNVFVHFAGGTPVATGTAISAKNNVFISVGGSTSFSGSMDGSSTTNAFNVGTTFGTSPITITPSAQFVDVSSHSAADLRLQTGVSLASAGVFVNAGPLTDIYYQSLTNPYSVGAFEQDGGGGGATLSLTLDTGVYSITGNSILTPVSLSVPLATGTYVITGNDVALGPLGHYTLSLGTGTYSITANDANIGIGTTLETGTYSITGNQVRLVSSTEIPPIRVGPSTISISIRIGI